MECAYEGRALKQDYLNTMAYLIGYKWAYLLLFIPERVYYLNNGETGSTGTEFNFIYEF
jgi:hypothetical protein